MILRGLGRRVAWLLIVGILATGLAHAQQPPAKADEPAQPTPESQDPAAPAEPGLSDVEILLNLRTAETNFDKVLTEARLPDSTRIEPKYDPARLAELRDTVDKLLAQMDSIMGTDKMTALRQDEVRVKKLNVLYNAVKFDKEKYRPLFDAYRDQIAASAQTEEGEDRRLTALMTAYQILLDYVDTKKPADEVMTRLEIYAQEYARSGWAGQLFMIRGDNLIEIGDVPGALAVYRRAIEIFNGDPRMAIVESKIKQLKMIGQPAEVTGPLYEGGDYDIAGHKDKVVLVDFWASWCGPCIESFPKIERLLKQYGDKGLEVIGVNLDTSKEELKAALERNPIPWPSIFAEPKENEVGGFESPLAAKFAIKYIPSLILIGKDGKIIGNNYTELAKLEADIVKALGLSAPVAAPSDEPTNPPGTPTPPAP